MRHFPTKQGSDRWRSSHRSIPARFLSLDYLGMLWFTCLDHLRVHLWG